MKKRIGIQGSLVITAFLLGLLFPKVFFRSFEPNVWDDALDQIGLFLILLGFTFRMVARGYKENHSQSSALLVESGPYAVIRNPMYLGTFTIGLGVVLSLFKLEFFAAFFCIYLLIYILQIRREEKYLTAAFGEAYLAYCQKVPRMFPSLNTIRHVFSLVNLRQEWIKKERQSMILVIIFCLLIETIKSVITAGWHEMWEEPLAALPLILLFSVFFLFSARKK